MVIILALFEAGVGVLIAVVLFLLGLLIGRALPWARPLFGALLFGGAALAGWLALTYMHSGRNPDERVISQILALGLLPPLLLALLAGWWLVRRR
ncbi:hypothetical protein [Deinococcus alpinitundrae]|uniref:hypothetical protein n=1 Tax=Deinococcus alpinitundrae TaxID=468913 RepID=UPI0013797BCA|nr:hypothetical protein [Deinococcus alpinitundrae]